MMKLGKQTGSLINHAYSQTKQPEPTVGRGATVLCWTDRAAGTIIQLLPHGGFVVQEDKAKRLDDNGMSENQSYVYEADPAGRLYTFKRVARGKHKGEIRENGRAAGRMALVGVRRKYHDFSF
jgi:hypothetical protein